MPQMSPMNWMTLFVMFSSMLIFVMLINYHSTQKTPLIQQHKSHPYTNTNILIWKW
uniref:ATP synthase F0 subunit 8 n=1 Tax=Tegra novaehollandiae viridinotata TaxID=1945547 RepID=A0A1Q1MP39_9ORTH|nr:ATP synthase F0 subunit 8 [Tegra novaehollandiae viridinotata]